MKRKCVYGNVHPDSSCIQETVKETEDNLLLGELPYYNTSVNMSHHTVHDTSGTPSECFCCLAFFFFFGFSFFPPSLLNFQARLFLTLYIFVKPKVNRPVGFLDSFYGWGKELKFI